MLLPETELVKKYAFFDKIKYEPHSAQKLFHNSGARFRMANCGRRFGKTTAVAMEIAYRMMQPNKKMWIIGNSYDVTEKEFRIVWEVLLSRLGIEPKRKLYNKQQGQLVIEMPWGTSVECRSTKYPDLLVGESLDCVVLSEAAKLDSNIYTRYIRPALSDKKGEMLAATTPEGHNWYYDMWSRGQNDPKGVYESWIFPSWSNTHVFPGGLTDPEIIQMQADMLDDEFEQEVAADFTSFVGKIYPEFEVGTHVKAVEYNPQLPNYIAFDFGYTNPLAAIEFQIDAEGCVSVWREHYQKFTTLEDHMIALKTRPQPEGYQIAAAFGDAADPEAVVCVSQSLVQCVADQRSKSNWREGVDLVRRKLKHKEIVDGEVVSSSKMVIAPSCVNLIREFNNYKANNPNKGRNVAECAVNQDDHALDALRYGLMHVEKLGYGTEFTEVYNLNVKPVIEDLPPVDRVTYTPWEGRGFFSESQMVF